MPRSRRRFERGDEALVVALVQADGGLVEDVEDAAQARADLGGEADALAFAAGERGGGAVEREVAEADGVEEFEALDDLALQAVGDDVVAAGEVHGARGGEGALEREGGEVGDGELRGVRWTHHRWFVVRGGCARRDGDGDGERFGAQAAALAARAGGRGHVLHHVLAVALGLGLFEVGAEVGEDAVEAGAAGFAFGRAVEEQVLLRLG